MGIYFSWNCFLQSPWTQLVWIRIDHTELVWCREVKDFSISYAMNILCHCFKNVIFKDELKVMLRANPCFIPQYYLFYSIYFIMKLYWKIELCSWKLNFHLIPIVCFLKFGDILYSMEDTQYIKYCYSWPQFTISYREYYRNR